MFSFQFQPGYTETRKTQLVKNSICLVYRDRRLSLKRMPVLFKEFIDIAGFYLKSLKRSPVLFKEFIDIAGFPLVILHSVS